VKLGEGSMNGPITLDPDGQSAIFPESDKKSVAVLLDDLFRT